MDPDVRARLDRANEERIAGNYEEAAKLYNEVLPLLAEGEEEAEARHGLGSVLLFTGMFDEGLEELKRAHEQSPNDPKIYLDLAKTHLMLGMYDIAQPQLAEIAELFPNTPEADEAKKQLSYF
ncbi:MAG: tetratricopeptide repeat protein [Armatimonadota bacterium]